MFYSKLTPEKVFVNDNYRTHFSKLTKSILDGFHLIYMIAICYNI